MLAHSVSIGTADLPDLRYPIAVTEKFDGIRCTVDYPRGNPAEGLVALSRTGIPLPNCHVQEWAEEWGVRGMDGEIVVPDWTFHEIQSKVMSNVTLPFPFRFYAFDYYLKCKEEPYLKRLERLDKFHTRLVGSNIDIIMPIMCHTPKQVKDIYDQIINKGGEGLILRDPEGPYKNGRSTFIQGWMLKMKQWDTGVARIIGFEEKETNENEQKKNNVGYAKRSSAKAGKRKAGTLGAFIVYDPDFGEFNIGGGPGLNDLQRLQIWQDREEYISRYINYKYQVAGVKEKPRSPQFLSFAARNRGT